MNTITTRPTTTAPTVRDRSTQLRRLAATTSAAMAVVYGLIYAGVLSVGRAEVGELGILGVAGAVFAVLAVLVWAVARPALWAAAAVLQVALAGMYVAIAPERDPAYELWGLTLRALSLVLLVALVALLVEHRRGRRRSAS
jgi:hypothetical protein